MGGDMYHLQEVDVVLSIIYGNFPLYLINTIFTENKCMEN